VGATQTRDEEALSASSHRGQTARRRRTALQWTTPLLFLVPFAFIIAVWVLAKQVLKVSDAVIPSLGDVIHASNELIDWGILPYDTSRSLYRIALGTVFATVIGVPIGLLLGMNRYSIIMFGPFLRFFRAVSGIAILPLLIVWFGFSETTIQVVILYTALIPVIFNTMVGVRTVPDVYRQAIETMGGGNLRLIRDVYIPGALASILVGIRLGVGYGWRALIAGEMLVGAGGLGFMIFNARQFHALGQIVAGMILIGVLYLIIDRLLLAPLEDATARRWGALRG
jgi:NitT/TauT family transport system permease protein/taurine transport system permease protein